MAILMTDFSPALVLKLARSLAVLALLALTACNGGRDTQSLPGLSGNGVVKQDQARFTVITPTLIRMEYAEDGQFEDRPTQTVAQRPQPQAAFTQKVGQGWLIVETAKLRLRYELDSGPFGADNLIIEVQKGDEIVEARPDWSFAPQPGNLGGWRRGLDNERDPQPLYEGVLSRAGWYLMNDSNTVLLTDTPPHFEARPASNGSYQDGYLFGYGLDLEQGLKDLRTLTGAAPLLPKKALGVWFSRWWAYTDPEWRDQVREFQERGVSLDTISIDTDWKLMHRQLGCVVWNAVIQAPLNDACSWNGWDWNRDIFPDPDGFVAWLHEQGIDVGLNVHPSIAGSDPAYPGVVAQTGPLMRDDADLPCSILQADPSTPCYIFDWTQASHYEAYFGLHEPIEETGIDFWWMDWCCEGSSAIAPGLSADTLINQGYYEQHQDMGSRWPAFSRIGGSFQNGKGGQDNNGLGAFAEHRYSLHFTGDTCSTWELMKFQADMTASEGNIGLPYVSHDIGSFLGEPQGSADCSNLLNLSPRLPEDMYVRWMQFGTFEPIMRLHSHHGDRLPWEYPGQAETIATAFLKLRGRLVPTLYTLSRVAHDTGLPMARSMYLQWPEIEAAYNYRSQYTVGDHMLVASVAAPGDPATINMWVPPGEWVDFFSGEVLSGPAEISRSVPLEHYAVFMRKGAILPLQPELLTSAYGPQDNLSLRVWPGDDGQFDLYEDEGRGFAYRDGAYQWTPLRLESDAGCATLRIEAAQGQNFPGALTSRSWQVEFMATDAPQSVLLNGQAISSGAGVPGWNYDASSRTVSVSTGSQPSNQATTVALDSGGCS